MLKRLVPGNVVGKKNKGYSAQLNVVVDKLHEMKEDNKDLTSALEEYIEASNALVRKKKKFQETVSRIMNRNENENCSMFPSGFCESLSEFQNEELDVFQRHMESSTAPLLKCLKDSKEEINELKKEKNKLKKLWNSSDEQTRTEHEQKVYFRLKEYSSELYFLIFSHAMSMSSSADQYRKHLQDTGYDVSNNVDSAIEHLSLYVESCKTEWEIEREELNMINTVDRSQIETIKLPQTLSCIPDIDRLPGEGLIQRIDNVLLLSQINTKPVVLFVTNYRIVLISSRLREKTLENSEKSKPIVDIVLEVPLLSICRFELLRQYSDLHLVQFHCSDLRQFVLSLSYSDISSTSFCDNIKPFIFADPDREIFAFFYRPVSGSVNGWSVYSFEEEYKRLGLPNGNFSESNVNQKYKVADTYPDKIICPSRICSSTLEESASFRSKKRMIAISWVDPQGYRAIGRCSQPLAGIARSRNSKDEQILLELERLASIAPDKGFAETEQSNLLIVDARPKVNAMANLAKGGGWENVDDLPIELSFLGIDNIHVVRESLSSLRKRFGNYMTLDNGKDNSFNKLDSVFSRMDIDSWVSVYRDILKQIRSEARVGSNSWLRLMSTLLMGAVNIAKSIAFDKQSVIVHCSDGWDRTAQLVALSSLMLDPYYRTMKGFAVLIEKEWLSFGHKFAERHGHAKKNRIKFADKQRSPVFFQFMDACFQVMSQNPETFEFNAQFLVAILDSLYSGRFGTFLCNTQSGRVELSLSDNTQSLWSELLCTSNQNAYLNQDYRPTKDIVLPYTSPDDLTLFLPYFIRWNKASFSSSEDDVVSILGKWDQPDYSRESIRSSRYSLNNFSGRITKLSL